MDHEGTERSPLPLILYPRFRIFPVNFFLVRLFKIRKSQFATGPCIHLETFSSQLISLLTRAQP